MIIEFDPMADLLPQKERDFVVKSFLKQGESDYGKWILVSLSVWDDEGKETEIRDLLSFSKNSLFKIKQFQQSIGRIDDYEKGKFKLDEYIGLKGRMENKHEYHDSHGAQNRVGKYLKKNEVEEKEEILDDDVPF